MDDAKKIINDLPDGDFKSVLTSFLNSGEDDLRKFKARIEKWFDDAMERVSGLYKRYTQYVMLVLGLLFAIFINIDSIHVAKTLWEQPTLAKAIGDQAESYVKQCNIGGDKLKDDPACLPSDLETVRNLIDKQTLPIGRGPDEPIFGASFLPALPGWIITAFAISLGAQFWFDLLIKLVNLRSAGPKPDRADAPKGT